MNTESWRRKRTAVKTLSLSVDGGAPLSLAVTPSTSRPARCATLALGNGLTETRTTAGGTSLPVRLAGTATLLDWSYTTDLTGNITAIQDILNPANNRGYGYQDNVYFLTQGNGPWGLRSWTYDRIGNRLTETRGAVTDSYVYPVNGASGHNPKLQSITLGAGGSRSYGYDEIGDTVQIVDTAQQLDLIHDASRRLTELMTRPEDRSVSFTYDGRSFLSEAGEEESACSRNRHPPSTTPKACSPPPRARLLDGAVDLSRQRHRPHLRRPAGGGPEPDAEHLQANLPDNRPSGTPAAATSESGTLLWEAASSLSARLGT